MLPVVRALAAEGVVVSVDTMRAAVAAAALAAGATMVNDVSGGLADARMARVVADAGSPYVVMHWRGHSEDMDRRAVYADVVTEVLDELQVRLDVLADAGVDLDRVVVDPGLGFAKRPEHNWAAAGPPRRPGGPRPAGAGGGVPEGLPRPAARRRRRVTAARGRARGRHHRGVGACGSRRRLGGAGA